MSSISSIDRNNLTLSEYTSLKSLIEKEINNFNDLFEDMTVRSYREELDIGEGFDERPLLIDELSKQMTLILGMKSITEDAERYDWSGILNKPKISPEKLDKEQLQEIYENMSKELDANPVLNVLKKDEVLN